MTNQLAHLLRDKELTGYSPDLITIMCGLNDAVRGPKTVGTFDYAMFAQTIDVSLQDFFSKADYKNLRESIYGTSKFVIEKIVRHFPNTLIVLINCQQANHGSYNNSNIIRINKALDTLAEAYHLPVIDVYKRNPLSLTSGT